jgi:hypothetical protein
MSSRAVRTLARTWAKTLATPYIETINISESAPDGSIWLTAEFDAFGWDKLSYCQDFQESGQVTLIWMGVNGTGDDAVLAAAEADALIFFSKVDPAGKLVLTGRSAPDTFETSGTTPEFLVSIDFQYTFNPN